jgi:hypothetical protein
MDANQMPRTPQQATETSGDLFQDGEREDSGLLRDVERWGEKGVTFAWLAVGADAVAIASLAISWSLIILCRKMVKETRHLIDTWEPTERALKTDEQTPGM